MLATPQPILKSTQYLNLDTNTNFDGLLEFLRDEQLGVSILSPTRFAEVLHIDLHTLAAQAHVHSNTISHAPASESVQRHLREVLRVIRAAMELNGDVNRVVFWYRNEPIPAFAYKTAEQLICEGKTESLLRYIESLEAGPSG